MGDKDDMTDKERRLAQLKEKWCCRCGHLKSLAQCSHEDSANSDSEREEDEHVDDDTNDADDEWYSIDNEHDGCCFSSVSSAANCKTSWPLSPCYCY